MKYSIQIRDINNRLIKEIDRGTVLPLDIFDPLKMQNILNENKITTPIKDLKILRITKI